MGPDERYLGVDVGTSALRASIIDGTGSLVAGASVAYHPLWSGGGVVEQSPEDWADALATALAQLGEAVAGVRAIGLCGQTPTLVLVDTEGAPVGPALTWQDTRARREAEELAERFGDPEPIIGTALAWSASNMPAKMLWLARYGGARYWGARWALQPKDFIGMTLSGSPLSDPWSCKGLCRVSDGTPATEVLEACGWPASICPPVAPPWQSRGVVTPEAAARFGLPVGRPVSTGWTDAMAQVLAAGCFERSSAFMFSGTSSVVGTPVNGGTWRAEGLFSVPTTCAPRALLYGPTQSAGAAVAWACRLLDCRPEELTAMATRARSPVPVFVPYLSGERSPLWDPEVRALLLGVAEDHGREEVARAVLAGVFLSARHILSLVEEATATTVDEVEVVGRGVGDPAWEAVALETLGMPLRFHDDADMSARGAAMLAATADGAELEEASRAMVDRARRAEPGTGAAEAAKASLEAYCRASEFSVAWRAAQAP